MPRARKSLVCVADTPFYLVTSRCVRRAYLCGLDRLTGKSFEHRRQWIEDRIRVLASLFCVDICAYAVMSNHYHIVVRLSPSDAEAWTDDEVLDRWTTLYRGPVLIQRYRSGEPLSRAEHDSVASMTAVFRARLASLSWFMKCLNEPIARFANQEDGCTGHFWEARFHSQALRTGRAVVAAMAYVDLNPVRAGIAKTPETSDHTSIKVRIRGDDLRGRVTDSTSRAGTIRRCRYPTKPLLELDDDDRKRLCAQALPIRKIEYFKLVDIAGRTIADGKPGRIDPTLAPILQRLGLDTVGWLQASASFRGRYRSGDVRTAI